MTVRDSDQQRRMLAVIDEATKLGFHNPADACRLLSDDDMADPVFARLALRDLAKAQPYLIRQPTSAAPAATKGEEEVLAEGGTGGALLRMARGYDESTTKTKEKTP